MADQIRVLRAALVAKVSGNHPVTCWPSLRDEWMRSTKKNKAVDGGLSQKTLHENYDKPTTFFIQFSLRSRNRRIHQRSLRYPREICEAALAPERTAVGIHQDAATGCIHRRRRCWSLPVSSSGDTRHDVYHCLLQLTLPHHIRDFVLHEPLAAQPLLILDLMPSAVCALRHVAGSHRRSVAVTFN